MIPLSLPTSHSMHSTCNHMAHPMHNGESSGCRRHLARLRALAQRHRVQQCRDSPRLSQRLASQSTSKSLLKEGMLVYHITAAITACIIIIDIAIPLTRANRLAAMRESDERITSILTHPSCEAPAFYVCPSLLCESMEGGPEEGFYEECRILSYFHKGVYGFVLP